MREGEKEGSRSGARQSARDGGRGGARELRRRSREFITVNISGASRPTPGGRSTWSEPCARPRAAPQARLRAVRTHASEESPPSSPAESRDPPNPRSSGAAGQLSAAFPARCTSFGVRWLGEAERGRRSRREGGGRGGRSQEKVACPNPGGGGGGGRGKTMPQLRRGRRREQARRAGRPGPGPLRGGARRSEAPASAPPRPDAAGDRAWLQQPPPSPPPPPGGPSESLDLGEGAALSGITTRAGRRPREPLQIAD
nr:translation initiation factor IF-2-like [Gorilla gorilla gorilla]